MGENEPVTAPHVPPRGSEALFARARRVTPGGVNSPVRAFNAVGGTPRFIRSGQGAWLTDVDGNQYVDLVCSWGALLLGHAHREVQEAIAAAVARGTSYGTPTEPAGTSPCSRYFQSAIHNLRASATNWNALVIHACERG